MFNEWYLARDKGWDGDMFIMACPAQFTSITKHKGCVEYRTEKRMKSRSGSFNFNTAWFISPKDCKCIFGHCPKKGELLCVKKTRRGWKSEKIELEFS